MHCKASEMVQIQVKDLKLESRLAIFHITHELDTNQAWNS